MSKYRDIKQAAANAIERAFFKGEKKHGEDAWRTRDDEEDLRHLAAHLTGYLLTGEPEDLDHLIARASTVKARRQK